MPQLLQKPLIELQSSLTQNDFAFPGTTAATATVAVELSPLAKQGFLFGGRSG